MRPRPYIGVTGFMSRLEVEAVLSIFPENGPRDLMVGVLASAKTMAEPPIPVRWPQRYPRKEDIADIFVDDPRAVNLVHYATDDRHTLGEQLPRIPGGDLMHGYQLNVAWPSINPMKQATKDRRVVLQIGRKAVEEAKDSPSQVAWELSFYRDFVTDVLFDPSGGKGLPLDLDRAAAFVKAIAEACPTLGIGIAGGLSADRLPEVAPLLKRFPFLSIDAEGRLRTENDHLDPGLTLAYVQRALEICS